MNQYFKGEGRVVDEILLINDNDTNNLLGQYKKTISEQYSNFKKISCFSIPTLNKITQQRISLPLEDGDCFIMSGTGIHSAMFFHNISSEFDLLNKHILLVHILPNGKKIIAYRFKKESDGIQVHHVSIPLRNSAQSLGKMLQEIDARFEVIEIERAMSKSAEEMILIESTSEIPEFRERMIAEYNLSDRTKVGYECERIATELLRTNHGEFKEIVLNINFPTGQSKVARQEEDILAMRHNGDIIWISCKFTIVRNTLNNELRRLELDLPIIFPQQRIHRILLTYSKLSQSLQVNDLYDETKAHLANFSNLIEVIDRISPNDN